MGLVAGLGLLGLGLTLIGDVFISDGSLRHIFYKMQFYHYYFYDILVGLAAASVVIGICTLLVAVLGLLGSWRKSKRFLITSSVLSFALHIPRVIAVVIWIVFIEEINDGMKFQLWLQQLGYFYGGNGNEITGKWNDMIMTLQCCGVHYYSETHTTQGIQFCCKHANLRILDKEDPNTNSYSGIFNYFGGCGGYKTDTCAEVILDKTDMFIGWFLAIVLLQIVLEV
ncbi:tetraspanin-3-like [Mytilus trossulus]|uniref:tetraspanin-3-like n=1 Tax=Mytilus trossulus TaxID=6551 RepID=UPI0030044800